MDLSMDLLMDLLMDLRLNEAQRLWIALLNAFSNGQLLSYRFS